MFKELINNLAKITQSQLREPASERELHELQSRFEEVPSQLLQVLSCANGEAARVPDSKTADAIVDTATHSPAKPSQSRTMMNPRNDKPYTTIVAAVNAIVNRR